MVTVTAADQLCLQLWLMEAVVTNHSSNPPTRNKTVVDAKETIIRCHSPDQAFRLEAEAEETLTKHHTMGNPSTVLIRILTCTHSLINDKM